MSRIAFISIVLTISMILAPPTAAIAARIDDCEEIGSLDSDKIVQMKNSGFSFDKIHLGSSSISIRKGKETVLILCDRATARWHIYERTENPNGISTNKDPVIPPIVAAPGGTYVSKFDRERSTEFKFSASDGKSCGSLRVENRNSGTNSIEFGISRRIITRHAQPSLTYPIMNVRFLKSNELVGAATRFGPDQCNRYSTGTDPDLENSLPVISKPSCGFLDFKNSNGGIKFSDPAFSCDRDGGHSRGRAGGSTQPSSNAQ